MYFDFKKSTFFQFLDILRIFSKVLVGILREKSPKNDNTYTYTLFYNTV